MLRTGRAMLLASVLSIPLAGCNQTSGSGSSACSLWKAISWSKKDTPETVGEIKDNNAKQTEFCK